MTKPHLFLLRNLWRCCSKYGVTGLGYSPAEAFAEWQKLNRSAS